MNSRFLVVVSSNNDHDHVHSFDHCFYANSEEDIMRRLPDYDENTYRGFSFTALDPESLQELGQGRKNGGTDSFMSIWKDVCPKCGRLEYLESTYHYNEFGGSTVWVQIDTPVCGTCFLDEKKELDDIYQKPQDDARKCAEAEIIEEVRKFCHSMFLTEEDKRFYMCATTWEDQTLDLKAHWSIEEEFSKWVDGVLATYGRREFDEQDVKMWVWECRICGGEDGRLETE